LLQEAGAEPSMAEMEYPQIEVKTHESDAEAQAELQRKVRELIEAAEKSEAPAAAIAAREECRRRVEHLRESHGRLTLRAREAQGKVREAAARLDEIWIAAPEKPKGVGEATRSLEEAEREFRSVSRAALRIAERQLPEAEIGLLFCEAEANFALCEELRKTGQERFRRTAELMSEAALHEGGIVFDPVNTVSGRLFAQADEYDRRGNEHLRWADERKVAFERLARELDPTI